MPIPAAFTIRSSGTSLRAKFAFGFAAALALFAAVGLFSLFQVQKVNDVAMTLRSVWTPRMELLADIRHLSSERRVFDARRVNTHGALSADARLSTKLETAIRNYGRLPVSVEEQILFGDFVEKWRGYELTIQDVFGKLEAGDSLAAVELFNITAFKIFDLAQKALERLDEYVEKGSAAATADANAAYKAAIVYTIATLLIATFCFVAAITWVTRQVAKPLLAVSDAMQRLSQGDHTATNDLDIARNDEIGVLARAASNYRDSLARSECAEQKAREAHEHLLDAFDVIPEGIVVLDADDRFLMWNKRYEELFGLSGGLKVGGRFEDALREGLAEGRYPEAAGREEEWLADRMSRHAKGSSRHELHIGDRWLQVEERRTASGGSIGVRIDITELKKREEAFRILFENNPVPMFFYDLTTLKFLGVNDAAVSQYGYSREQFLNMILRDLRVPAMRDAPIPAFYEVNGKLYNVGHGKHQKADGTAMDVEFHGRKLLYEDRIVGIAAVLDITERKRAQHDLENTRDFLDNIIEAVPSAILVKDVGSFKYVLANRAAEKYLGRPREEISGHTVHELFPKRIADALTWRERRLLESGATQSSLFEESPVHGPQDDPRIVNNRIIVVRNKDGFPRYVLDVVDDITDQKRAEAQVAHLALHDALTDMPNRAAFDQRFAGEIDAAATAGGTLAVLCMDLDRFKDVNDVYGHPIGDALLKAACGRMKATVGDAFVARVGGDEFNLLVARDTQPAELQALAERLIAAVGDAYEISGQRLRIGVSVGVAIFPRDGIDSATLLGHADAALYRAKAEGRGNVQFFDSQLDKQLREQRLLQKDLRLAIDRSEFMMHYQPQQSVNGKTVGFEALLRWNHPTRGFVSPGEFIPVAEESGIIVEIGEWALREACREAASWPQPLQIAVNLSPVQFLQGNLPELVLQILLETGLPGERLELEITEGVLIGDFSRATAILGRLKALGVRIAMDDFGTGYSSLSYLQSFPFDKIKIDRAFIRDLENNAQAAAIVRAVIGLGHGLNLPVVAEGVETGDQLSFLRSESCDEIQGYLIGKPAPINQYDALVGRPPRLQLLPGGRRDVA